MNTACITCEGEGRVPQNRMGALPGDTEPCRTCKGAGVYDALTGPGVDHTRAHGTGRKED